MEVSAGEMGPVICKLAELLVGEYNLEKRVKKGVQSLLTELEMMHAVLRKVGEVPSEQLEEPVRIWAGKVRDLSCDMEDAVDDFLVRVDEGSSIQPMNMRNRVKKFLKKTTKLFSKGKALHQICDAIEEAQDLAKELAELRKRCRGDGTRDDLIKTLICEDGSCKEQLKIISIVGVGGLDKTTLTKAFFEKIKAQFDRAAFVPVGQNPDIRKIFKDLLYGLDKEKFKDIHKTTRDEKLLMEEISEFLLDKRYLIIIDDIWEEEIWRYINCALYKNKLHSRIIITTRNVSVSEACLSFGDGMIQRMKPLSDEDSQILFHRRIFQSKQKCPEDLQVVSRDILKKYAGVPLAIVTIASLLVSSQRVKPKHEWMHVYNSMGCGVTQNGIAKDMKRILSLSYYDLPPHLKTCLLYLSIFPEDFEVERDWLIWRWLAEGFIQCNQKESSLFEIGKSYFNELMNRSLLQPAYIEAFNFCVCWILEILASGRGALASASSMLGI
ncbi:hypothetical protein CFC21_107383 [Triticum aestivum]|uniref:NB-ARC domain-containing protein n=2 Tax=Triticum aestivum TaxID=4565 RepID=A0A9R1MG22_WHEAT|nr:hypothetical protein CFC21_107383 [Triticum aestivum]